MLITYNLVKDEIFTADTKQCGNREIEFHCSDLLIIDQISAKREIKQSDLYMTIHSVYITTRMNRNLKLLSMFANAKCFYHSKWDTKMCRILEVSNLSDVILFSPIILKLNAYQTVCIIFFFISLYLNLSLYKSIQTKMLLFLN